MTKAKILSHFLNIRTATRKDCLGDAFTSILTSGDYAEFGVGNGDSARRILNLLPKRSNLYLFDSFEGLPEDWREGYPKGMFKIEEHRIPTFSDDRVELYRGLFKDTIPLYLLNSVHNLAFIHIDCDLYSSTRDVLFGVNSKIVPGTILLFHEFWKYPGWEKHEFKAFAEWVIQTDRDYMVIGKYPTEQTVIGIL